jgi:hypothetical protein
MTRHVAVCLCLAAAARAQIGVPRAGCVRAQDGSLRPLYGTAAAFVPGAVVQTGVISVACSDQLALVKTEHALEVRDAGLRLIARWPAPVGPARFAFTSRGDAGFVYLEATGDVMRVDGSRAPRLVLDSESLGGVPLALASPNPQHVSALVRSAAGIRLTRIALGTRAIEQDVELKGIAGPVMLRRDGTLLYTESAEVVVLRPGGRERRFALPARAASIYEMGESLAGITFTNGTAPAALRLQDGREQLLRVPEAAR